MPYTKRIAVHDGVKGMSACIEYILNEDKTDGGMFASGVNCNLNFAVREMWANIEKWHKEDDARAGYHVIQSFDYRDDISPELVHEIGIKLAKELYSEFQCVVATHVDKGHLHNHIFINATNLNGKKLEDRLANQKEGLYALRAASDRLGLEYGCRVMEDFKPIGRYKSKKYERSDKEKLYEYATISWKSVITQKLNELKLECTSFDELLERLALDGYIIKRGKNIKIKPYGKTNFSTMKTLGEEYSEAALKQYFKNKLSLEQKSFSNYTIVNKDSLLLQDIDTLAKSSRMSIELSSNSLKENVKYPKYFHSRYLEMKRYHRLVKLINRLNDENITSFDELHNKIDELVIDLNERKLEYEKQKSLNNEMQKDVPIAEIYLERYKDYRIYQEGVEAFGEAGVRMSEEVELFLSAKNQLNNATFEEVKEFLVKSEKIKREANKQCAYISYLSNRISELENIRGDALKEQGYIKGMSFSNRMIDEERTNDDHYCVRLPYTDYYVYLPMASVAWNNYGKRATMYLIDDEKYKIYNDRNEVIDEVEGNDLEELSKVGKEEKQAYYTKS